MKYTPLACCPCCKKAAEHEPDDHMFQCPNHPPKKIRDKGVQTVETTIL